jgi:hypothetical protein
VLDGVTTMEKIMGSCSFRAVKRPNQPGVREDSSFAKILGYFSHSHIIEFFFKILLLLLLLEKRKKEKYMIFDPQNVCQEDMLGQTEPGPTTLFS